MADPLAKTVPDTFFASGGAANSVSTAERQKSR